MTSSRLNKKEKEEKKSAWSASDQITLNCRPKWVELGIKKKQNQSENQKFARETASAKKHFPKNNSFVVINQRRNKNKFNKKLLTCLFELE